MIKFIPPLLAIGLFSTNNYAATTGQEFSLNLPVVQQQALQPISAKEAILQAKEQIKNAQAYIGLVGALAENYSDTHQVIINLTNRCQMNAESEIIGRYNKRYYVQTCQKEAKALQQILSNAKKFLGKHNDSIKRVQQLISSSEMTMLHAEDVRVARSALRILEEQSAEIANLNKLMDL